jgi:hypothetical protein
MIALLEVNTYASMLLECVANANRERADEIFVALEKKTQDRREVLAKLEARATESGSDNSWNRYESVDEAYAYAEELANLALELSSGDSDFDDLEWQIRDLEDKTKREAFYRLERAQW